MKREGQRGLMRFFGRYAHLGYGGRQTIEQKESEALLDDANAHPADAAKDQKLREGLLNNY